MKCMCYHSWFYYRPPTEWRRYYFQSCVSLILFLLKGVRSMYSTYALNPSLYRTRAPAPAPFCTGPCPPPCPGHVQTRSLLSTDCQKAGHWHSNEMPSCWHWTVTSSLGCNENVWNIQKNTPFSTPFDMTILVQKSIFSCNTPDAFHHNWQLKYR